MLPIARCGTATRLVAGRSTSTARGSTPPARYYGAACDYTGFARIDLAWTGARSLRVVMDAPLLEWTLTATETPTLRLLNTISAALPISTWRPRPLVRSRELLARALGMGDMRMTGVMPSGHIGTLMPRQMFFIERATAVLDGADLGRPAHLRESPRIGQIPLPTRGVLGIGQAVWQTLDPAEYERTRAETAPLA